MMNNLKEFKSHVLDCYPQEACGVIIDEKFVPLANSHPDPANNFLVSEEDSFSLASLNRDYIIIHSHTFDRFKNDPRTPSHEDTKGQQADGHLWAIVHCDGESVTDPISFGFPSSDEVLGRRYISNVYDCFTIARDYYWQNRNIDLGSHPRPEKWEDWNPRYIENNYSELGFNQLPEFEPLIEGDVVLFKIASLNINHIGIVLDEDTFIHHLYNRKSCKDSIHKWHSQLAKKLRLNYGT